MKKLFIIGTSLLSLTLYENACSAAAESYEHDRPHLTRTTAEPAEHNPVAATLEKYCDNFQRAASPQDKDLLRSIVNLEKGKRTKSPQYIKALIGLGNTIGGESATGHYVNALKEAIVIENQRLQALALIGLGNAKNKKTYDFIETIGYVPGSNAHHYKAALIRARSIGDNYLIMKALIGLGNSTKKQQRRSPYFTEALDIATSLKLYNFVAEAHYGLGNSMINLCNKAPDDKEAKTQIRYHYRKAIIAAGKAGDFYMQAKALYGLGNTKGADRIDCYEKALEISEEHKEARPINYNIRKVLTGMLQDTRISWPPEQKERLSNMLEGVSTTATASATTSSDLKTQIAETRKVLLASAPAGATGQSRPQVIAVRPMGAAASAAHAHGPVHPLQVAPVIPPQRRSGPHAALSPYGGAAAYPAQHTAPVDRRGTASHIKLLLSRGRGNVGGVMVPHFEEALRLANLYRNTPLQVEALLDLGRTNAYGDRIRHFEEALKRANAANIRGLQVIALLELGKSNTGISRIECFKDALRRANGLKNIPLQIAALLELGRYRADGVKIPHLEEAVKRALSTGNPPLIEKTKAALHQAHLEERRVMASYAPAGAAGRASYYPPTTPHHRPVVRTDGYARGYSPAPSMAPAARGIHRVAMSAPHYSPDMIPNSYARSPLSAPAVSPQGRGGHWTPGPRPPQNTGALARGAAAYSARATQATAMPTETDVRSHNSRIIPAAFDRREMGNESALASPRQDHYDDEVASDAVSSALESSGSTRDSLPHQDTNETIPDTPNEEDPSALESPEAKAKLARAHELQRVSSQTGSEAPSLGLSGAISPADIPWTIGRTTLAGDEVAAAPLKLTLGRSVTPVLAAEDTAAKPSGGSA